MQGPLTDLPRASALTYVPLAKRPQVLPDTDTLVSITDPQIRVQVPLRCLGL